MLNLNFVKVAMDECGLSQAALADLCAVSREAVSKWLAGESVPRPNKVKLMAEALKTSVKSLYLAEADNALPVVAYRTIKNVAASLEAEKVALDMAKHMRQLVPLLKEPRLFSAPVLQEPSTDEAYVRRAARATRDRLGLSPTEPLSRKQLIGLHEVFGSILVPVLWSGALCGHENALSVWLAESNSSFVIFSLNAKNDDFNYWLAHELGHSYTLHALREEQGEAFAESFAQELLFPIAAAESVLPQLRQSSDPLAHAHFIADAFGISVVTIIRQADKAAKQLGEALTGLETPDFWDTWSSRRHLVPTVAFALFGSELTTSAEYVEKAERYFKTSIFHALAKYQQFEGGRSPAFLSAALNIDLSQAYELSHVLMERFA
jgi:transcriptional regulator with XRE-family HTH domain